MDFCVDVSCNVVEKNICDQNKNEKVILVLGGGGARGSLQVGALDKLEKTKWVNLNNCRVFIGTSIGAILCLLYSCGFSSEEIYKDFLMKLKKVFYLTVFFNSKLFSFKNKSGLFGRKFLRNLLIDCLSKKGILSSSSEKEKDITFEKLFERTGRKTTLVVCISNLTLGTSEFYSHENHPDKNVLESVLTSAAFPFLFSATFDTTNEHVLSDGGIFNNFPISKAFEFKHDRLIAISLDNFPVTKKKQIPNGLFKMFKYFINSISYTERERIDKKLYKKYYQQLPEESEKIKTFDFYSKKKLRLGYDLGHKIDFETIIENEEKKKIQNKTS